MIDSRQANLQSKKVSPLLATTLWTLLSVSLLGMSGCATKNHVKAEPAIMTSDTTPISVNESDGSLSPEFIYRYLAAEIAGQRGDLGASGAIFYDLARTERDPRLAERAAKIAAFGNMPNLAIPAIKLWAELDPSSTEAQQAMTEMLIATGKVSETEPYLTRLLSKEETRANGFLYINSILGRSKDKDAVLKLVQSLAAPYPDLAEAHFAVAQAAWSANQDEVALQAINEAETLQPDWDIAVLLKGQILFRQSPQTAINHYYSFLKTHPDANEIRLNLAKLLVNQKQYEEAKLQYPLIIKYAKSNSSKNMADVITIIGLLSYQSADYKGAESYFQQALSLDFKDTDQLHLYLGQTAEKQHHDDDAIEWYKKIALGPRYLEAQIGLANVIARTESVENAIALLDGLENLNTDQQIIVAQAQSSILAKAKRNQEAFDLLEKTVKNSPNTPELIYDYALAAERIGKFDLMESELRKAMKIKPDFAAAYNALGYSFADRNIRLNEAIKLIEKALSMSPDDHYMLDSLGWAYYRKGDLDKAASYLQKAYDINPDPEIAAHLGEVLWHKGLYEQAKKIWNDALIINPDNEILVITANKFKS